MNSGRDLLFAFFTHRKIADVLFTVTGMVQETGRSGNIAEVKKGNCRGDKVRR